MEDEARRHLRIDSENLSYLCVDDDGKEVAQGIGRTLNVSKSGLCLETNLKAELNHNLMLTIALEDDLVDIKGQVVNCREREDGMYEIGVELVELNDKTKELYLKYLRLFQNENM